jgi:hypothetical protein
MAHYDIIVLILFFGRQIHSDIEEHCLGSVYVAGKRYGVY